MVKWRNSDDVLLWLSTYELVTICLDTAKHHGQDIMVEHGGALVEAITLNRRVVGSTPALAAM